MTEYLPDTNVGNIEYISRHAAIIEMMDNEVDHAQGTDGREVVQILSDIPAADVAPVVHGKYVGEYDGYADGNPVCDMWYCSVCGCCFEDWDEKPTYNFCPNCGAKMVE